jgi:hypothetical protein
MSSFFNRITGASPSSRKSDVSSNSSMGNESNASYISAVSQQCVDKANDHIQIQNEVNQTLVKSNEEYKKMTT